MKRAAIRFSSRRLLQNLESALEGNVRLLFERRVGGDKEASQIPSRGRVRQQFVGRGVRVVRPDQVQAQSLDQFIANSG